MARFIPIISIIILVLLIVGGYFYWWPEYQKFQELSLELKIKNATIRQEEEYLRELTNLSNKLADYKEALSKIDSAIPLEPSIPALFQFIQETSSENGLTLNEIRLMGITLIQPQPEKEEKIKQISLGISVSGSYTSLKNFLSSIYKNARIIEVESINFSSPKGTSFDFDLNLKTYAF